MIVDILKKIENFEKKFEFFFVFYFFTRIIYIPMAVKSDSNYTIIIYYCNTVVIVFNSTVYYRLASFTVVLESLIASTI